MCITQYHHVILIQQTMIRNLIITERLEGET